MARKKLDRFLTPASVNVIPNVIDDNNTVVRVENNNVLTNNFTTVNIGDTPNSNNGDPLRLAFAKINNFIEAVYHHDNNLNASLDSDMTLIKNKLQAISVHLGLGL